MGMTVTTDDKGVKVIAKEREGKNGTFKVYSLMVSSKQPDDTWVNGFIDCAFKRGLEDVPNKSKIKIKNAFYTVTSYKEKGYPKLMITDFEFIEKGIEEGATSSDSFMNIPEGMQEEMPFN